MFIKAHYKRDATAYAARVGLITKKLSWLMTQEVSRLILVATAYDTRGATYCREVLGVYFPYRLVIIGTSASHT